MSLYVQRVYPSNTQGIPQYLLTADTVDELLKAVNDLKLDEEYVCRNENHIFAMLSRTKYKLAKNLGALEGQDLAAVKNIKRDMIEKGYLTYE